jgi:hypothetical protein
VSAQQTLKIGAINPYSGPLALYGTEVTRGYELAVDQINASGVFWAKKSSWFVVMPPTLNKGLPPLSSWPHAIK